MSYPIHWDYPSTGPAPPTPVVVNTVPAYFGGRPTPPPTPPRAARTVDDHAPCPPTPRCVPSSAHEDEAEWSDTLSFGTSQSIPSECRLTSELDQSTVFVDPLTELASNDSGSRTQYDDPHISDYCIYAPELYAYPSPILTMIERATLDLNGHQTRPVNPRACGQPLELFSLTAGHIPVTGLEKHDEQSFDYYVIIDSPLLRELDRYISYRFSIGTIQALQRELCERWFAVYPEPILPVIIRSRDLIGPYKLTRRDDGHAFVVPTEDSIWSTICQRGIDSTFRPIDRSATVETGICSKDDALYYPQHIVASKFAVNVFLELPDSEIGSTPLCEYLGAYVLQVVDGRTIGRSVWRDIDPKVRQSVFNRVPHRFKGSKRPSRGPPRLPYVQFCYYQWDPCIIRLANGLTSSRRVEASPNVNSIVRASSRTTSIYSDSCFGALDRDTASTPSSYTSEYTSFLRLVL